MKKITITAETGTGAISQRSTNYTDLRNGSGTNETEYLNSENRSQAVSASYEFGTYYLTRSFFRFNLNEFFPVTDTAYNIIKARIILHGYDKGDASMLAVVGCDDIHDFTVQHSNLYSDNFDYPWNSSDRNSFYLTTDGLNYLKDRLSNPQVDPNDNAVADFAVINYLYDYFNNPPLDGVYVENGLFYSETSNEWQKPTLEIFYDFNTVTPKLKSVVKFDNDGDLYHILGDGSIASDTVSASSWNTIRNAESGNYVTVDGKLHTHVNCQQISSSEAGVDNFNITRSLITFPYDFIKGAQITSATLTLHTKTQYDHGNSVFPAVLCARESTHNPNSVITESDFSSFVNGAGHFGSVNIAETDDEVDKNIVFLSEGVSYLNKVSGYIPSTNSNDYVTLMLQEYEHDYLNVEINEHNHTIYTYGASGFEKRPILTITGFNTTNITRDLCLENDWYWYSNQCNQDLPDTKAVCEFLNYYWYDGKSECWDYLPDNARECEAEGFYWYNGECRYTNKLGSVKCTCVDRVSNIWLIAGHEVFSIDEVFVSTQGSTEPEVRTGGFNAFASYSCASGLNGKVSVIQFFDNPPSEEDTVLVNVKGMKNISSELIEDPVEIFEHFAGNYLNLTAGNDWNTTTVNETKTVSNGRYYKAAGLIDPEDDVTGRDVVEEILNSFDMTIYFDMNGLINIKFIN